MLAAIDPAAAAAHLDAAIAELPKERLEEQHIRRGPRAAMEPSRYHGPMSARISLLLRDHKEALIERWLKRVLDDPKVPKANRLPSPELRDHVPLLIDDLADALAKLETGGEAAGRELGNDSKAREHAQLRFTERYSVAEAVRELSHFRAAVLDLYSERGAPLDGQAAQLIHATIDESMITVATEMEHAVTEELRQDAVFRERFVGIVGHDLRNPLAAICFGSAFLLKIGETPDTVLKVVRRIALSADRMTRMINDLLDFTRSRSDGGIPVEPKPTDLETICRQVIGELQVVHPGRAIGLSAQGDRAGLWDSDRLAQVVSNLVSNALTHSPPETPVGVTLRGDADTVTLEVRNEGAPIPPETMAEIFDPFRRGKRVSTGRSAGLGLGLFIAKNILDAHGGTIAVDSAAERGTTFTVRLPREHARHRDRRAAEPAQESP
jgi:signal transduction histidine kinase